MVGCAGRSFEADEILIATSRRPHQDGIGLETVGLAPDVVTAQVGYASVAGAALMRDDAHGEAKLVVDRKSGTLLGATFVGPGAGELIHAVTIAITGSIPVHRLSHAVPAFPTASEIWLRLIESLPSGVLHRN